MVLNKIHFSRKHQFCSKTTTWQTCSVVSKAADRTGSGPGHGAHHAPLSPLPSLFFSQVARINLFVFNKRKSGEERENMEQIESTLFVACWVELVPKIQYKHCCANLSRMTDLLDI